jgi:hypothetical protein
MTQTGDVRFQSHDELIRRLEEAETWEKMRHEQVKELTNALRKIRDRGYDESSTDRTAFFWTWAKGIAAEALKGYP